MAQLVVLLLAAHCAWWIPCIWLGKYDVAFLTHYVVPGVPWLTMSGNAARFSSAGLIVPHSAL